MAAMVIEVPEELKDLGVAMLEAMATVKKMLGGVVGGKALDYDSVECAIADGVAKFERAGHRAILAALDIDRPAVMIGGDRYARVGRSEATSYTMAGPVVIERSLYRRCGERNAKVVDAVSLRAGVVADGWLQRTARAMAYDVQKATSREAETSVREHKRLEYSRSSFERVAHAVGALYVPAHVDIEDALIEAYEIPAEARSVSASLDRVSLPMEEPRARPVGRPKKGAAKRPVTRAYRMAYCGTVTLHDGDGNSLHTIRYGRMPASDAKGLVEGDGRRRGRAPAQAASAQGPAPVRRRARDGTSSRSTSPRSCSGSRSTSSWTSATSSRSSATRRARSTSARPRRRRSCNAGSSPS